MYFWNFPDLPVMGGKDVFKKKKKADFEFVVYLLEMSVVQSCSALHNRPTEQQSSDLKITMEANHHSMSVQFSLQRFDCSHVKV